MRPHVLIVDNYDSFTYNLVQALAVLGARVTVRRNDRVTVPEASELEPTHLLVSPGPGRPEEAGVSVAMVRAFLGRRPILGVCLGHQALCAALGGTVVAARRLVHGKASRVHHDGRTIFEGLPNPFEAGRYHSLAILEESVPPDLEISARTEDGEIMAVRHRTLFAEGVQFHPESVLTPRGPLLLRNFLHGGRKVVGAPDSPSPG